MKTKVILLITAVSALLYSCRTENEDEATKPAAASKVELKKLNQGNQTNAKSGDSISVAPAPPKAMNSDGDGLPPENPNPDDSEIVHPGGVKPPKP